MRRNMIRGLAGAVLLATGAAVHPGPAASQQLHLICASHDELAGFLDAQYSEKLSAIGMVDPATIIEVYAAASGSWTLTMTGISGRSCVILTGQSWETIPALPASKA